MIGQRADALRVRPAIHDEGCYFLCLVYLGWQFGDDPGRIITADAVIGWYDEAVGDGAMEADCYVNRPQAIVDMVGGRLRWVELCDPRPLAPDEHSVELWELPSRGWEHFVTGEYDPWIRSLTRRHGRIKSLRVFEEFPPPP